MPLTRSGHSSRSSASRHNRQSLRSLAMGGVRRALPLAPDAQDARVHQVDAPAAIQRVEALDDVVRLAGPLHAALVGGVARAVATRPSAAMVQNHASSTLRNGWVDWFARLGGGVAGNMQSAAAAMVAVSFLGARVDEHNKNIKPQVALQEGSAYTQMTAAFFRCFRFRFNHTANGPSDVASRCSSVSIPRATLTVLRRLAKLIDYTGRILPSV